MKIIRKCYSLKTGFPICKKMSYKPLVFIARKIRICRCTLNQIGDSDLKNASRSRNEINNWIMFWYYLLKIIKGQQFCQSSKPVILLTFRHEDISALEYFDMVIFRHHGCFSTGTFQYTDILAHGCFGTCNFGTVQNKIDISAWVPLCRNVPVL